jgi:hypothetical protein
MRSLERRRFVGGLTGTTFGILAGKAGLAQIGANAVLSVTYDEPGRDIPPDFVGLSYESAILAGGGYFASDGASVLGLIRALGPSGVIRIGGNTSERTVWRSQTSAEPENSVITPVSIDRLAAALRIVGWKLIYGLNLARGTPEQAAEEAAYVAQAVRSTLLAFQIGNEPDGFGRWTAVRPKPYDHATFFAEWRRFHKAIRARVPNAAFAGPDVAAETDWVGAFAEQRPEGLVLLTRHYYADGPAGAPHVTLAKLLQSDRQLAPVLAKLAQYSRQYGLPYRIAEANSIYNEGQPGVSNTLGAALWGLELMFEAAAAGAAGVNFHAGVHNLRPAQDKAYTPIARSGDGRYRAAPLYYAMLAFAQTSRGALIPTQLASESTATLKAFAVRAPDGALRICVINKDFTRDAHVTIDLPRRFAAGSMMRLSGAAADAISGVTLGAATMDEFGAWRPIAEAVDIVNGRLRVELPPSSAALISCQPEQ